MLRMQLISIVALFAGVGGCVFEDGAGSAIAGDVDFTRDVRPILSSRCLKCHGPDEETREAGLRLDVRAAAIGELESGEVAVVPGEADGSGLIERVTAEDADLRMPPAGQGDPLSPSEVKILRDWIAGGAMYSAHWSFAPIERSRLPDVEDSDWCANGIDRYVLARLVEEGLMPSEEADRATLVRRLSLSLTGLPPDVLDVERFVSDGSVDAYANLVDRLMSSPAYGERWARIWLDLARYADSAGYADDPPRTIWTYRDWVIQAINRDMPFDQFSVEQLAGDLLPNASDDQLLATAFHRNTMTNSEGGTDDEEFRNAAIVDRVNTTMQVWMGLTMGCAQCHTHKYDPITQQEYYQVFAIFNQTQDADRRDEVPVLKLFAEEQQRERNALLDQISEVEQKLADRSRQENRPTLGDDRRRPLGVRTIRIELPNREEFLSLAEVEVFVAGKNIAIDGKARQSSTDYGGAAERAIDGNTDGDYSGAESTTHTKKTKSPWWEVQLAEAVRVENVVVWNRNDSPGIGKRLDPFRLVLLDDDHQAVWVRSNIAAAGESIVIDVPANQGELSKDDVQQLLAYRTEHSPELEKLRSQIAGLKKKLDSIRPIPTPIMRRRPQDDLRKTHIQVRGNFLDLGEQVQPGALSLFAFDREPLEVSDRLELARWLFDSQNPLTARVVANRYWEAMFGIGLVETSEDFGMQGELPTHPELLDWLAMELMESGWDTRHLIRLIVTSSTYRQRSSASGDIMERDPLNRLLARGPRFRLSAEKVRDQALSVGGLMSHKMYGPPVYPPRPKMGLKAAFGKSTDWETSPGEDRHRRGLYTWWQRTLPYPSMDTFDAPSREVCTIRRSRTNTPLQALVTLNDPVYVEAARGLAGRMLGDVAGSEFERIAYGFQLCVSREPTGSEVAVLQRLLNQARDKFANDAAGAVSLRVITAADLSEIDDEEQAAWSVLANVLLNLDETLSPR